ncbi:hypothetical protein SKAU_G00204910 [Synaphobranchus kaupii]|uniref:Ig-like domain-containing protein n=1 Tax=Synaphobranchus kaupii TaxID=118154 RepID=A0A9Q1IWF7_SYNKA|nr:hypothetical protein SKAU_G00204910 [Synaphobranchus kaupii]
MALRMLWIFVFPAAFSSDFYLEPRKSTSQVGDRLVLKCGARNCQKAEFTWRRLGDQPLMHTSETKPSPTESQLVIDGVTVEHKPNILCIAVCGDRKVQKTTVINVYSFPADPVLSGNDRLRHGEKSDITCVVRDVYPVERLKIEWVQGETVLSETSGDQLSVKDEIETQSFVYSYIPHFGDGEKSVTCRATLDLPGIPNNQKTRQTTVNLTVQLLFPWSRPAVPPQNTTVTVSPSRQVQEGQNVTISCRTVSFPPAHFVLTKDGSDKELVSQDGTFRLPQVTPHDAGLYQLNISNWLGSHTELLTLSVMAPPRNTTVTVSPSRQVQEGQNVTISCRTVSFPPAHFVLTKDGSDKELVSQDGTFRLPQVTPHDAGLYQLNVSNRLGSHTELLTLSVTAPPRNTTVTVFPSRQVQEGQNITISCRTVSFPPAHFVLTKDGSDKELVSQDGTFQLPQVTPHDAGLYQLNISNRLGSHTELLTLSVMEQYRAPEDTPILPTLIVPAIGAGAMVTTAAVLMRYLKRSNGRRVYELAKGV